LGVEEGQPDSGSPDVLEDPGEKHRLGFARAGGSQNVEVEEAVLASHGDGQAGEGRGSAEGQRQGISGMGAAAASLRAGEPSQQASRQGGSQKERSRTGSGRSTGDGVQAPNGPSQDGGTAEE
jgi:hypothetical protein